MKRLLALLVLTFCLGGMASAQTYDVSWYKIAGGGGSSTGGVFSVSGTIGQPDASGSLSGGNYTITGGFWSLVSVVQTVGSPLLSIGIATTNVVISWPASSTGFTLQQNGRFGTTNWTAFNTNLHPIISTNGVYSVSFRPTSNTFFRLVQ